MAILLSSFMAIKSHSKLDNLTFIPIYPLPYQATIQACSYVSQLFPETHYFALCHSFLLRVHAYLWSKFYTL